MKYILLIVVLGVLIGGWYIWTNEAEAPIVDENNNTNEIDQENDFMDDDVPSSEDNSMDSEMTETQNEDNNVPEQTSDGGDTKVFNISAENFAFDVTEMRVQEGDTVTINFTVTEGLHDLVIDEFDVATPQMTANGQSSVTFVADEAGTYEYYCSVMNHRAQGMVGTLIVE